MTPPRSLDAVRRDDELLDRLAARAATPHDAPGDAQTDDPALRLLAALAADVDRDLPADVDSVAVQALAAAVATRSRAAEAVTTGSSPAVSVVRELPRRRRVVAVRRGGAVVAGLALVLASAGVAAAVTGDPAGAFGLRAVSAIVDHVTHRRSASAAATDDLQRRLQAAEHLPVVDPSVVATLEAQARRLPDQGGPQVQAALARLRERLRSATGAPEGHGSPNGPEGSASPEHPERAEPTGPTGTTGRQGHGKASGRPTHTASSGKATGSHGRSTHGSGATASATTSTGAAPLVSSTSGGSGDGQGGQGGQGAGHGGQGGGQGAGHAGQGSSAGHGGGSGGGAGGRGSTVVRPG